MKDQYKTKKQLIEELEVLRNQLAKPKKIESDHKRAGEALEESEETFKALAENANDGIFVNIGEGLHAYANKRASEIMGYSVAELLKSTIKDLVHPDELEKIMERYRKRLADEPIPAQYETVMVNKEGKNVPIELTAARTVWQGQPADLVILRDISERKKAEATLQESEEKYRNVVERANDGIAIGQDDILQYVNPRLAQMIGYSVEELIGSPFSDFFIPDEGAKVANRYKRRLAGEDVPPVYESALKHKNGSRIEIELNAGIVTYQGKPADLVLVRDITGRKKMEEALREKQEMINAIIETSQDWIWAIDRKGMHTYSNQALEKILGYRPEEIIDRSSFDLMHEGDKEMVESILRECEEKQCGWSNLLLRWLHKDGTYRFLESNAVPILNTKGDLVGFMGVDRDITERKRTEEAVRESEKKYRTVVEIIPEGIAIASKGRHVFANRGLANIFGVSATDELLGKPVMDYIHPDYRKIVGERIEQQIKRGESAPLMEEKMLRADGTVIYTEVIAAPLEYEGEQAILAVIRDITERKRTEEAVRESEERFRLAFENADIGVCLVDLEGNLTRVNNKMCEIFGYTKEELERMTVNDIAYPEDVNLSPEFIQKTLRGEIDRGMFEKRYFHKKGHVVTCQLSSALVRDASDTPLYFISHLYNITEHKQAEELLQKERETSLSILDNAPYGVALIDKGSQYIYINPQFTAITGYTLPDIPTGKDWLQKAFPEPKYREKMIQVWKEDRSRGNIINRECSITCKDGTIREIETRSTFLRDGRAITVLLDITEQKRSKERMESLQEQLRQSQKMEAIGRLAGGIAHDFNNILTIIKGYSQLSLIQLKEDTPLKGNIMHIHTAADRAAELVRQLLAFSRRQILEMKVLDLNTILTNLHNMLRRLIGEDIELVTLLAEDLGRVKTDLGWIEQVIMNLVVNAKDAMPSGGKLTIETGNTDLDEAYVGDRDGMKPGRYVMLSVNDTGIGMTPEVTERLFEPFFSTKDKDKGTGLGLSTVYGIVKQSGGDIWVYSEPGKGSTFKIYLPRVDEPLEERREKFLGNELLRGSETILLVEDEEEVRKLAVGVLERQGYKVLAARDGDEALLICKRHQDSIHLMLTDVVMPGMNGHEVAKRLESLHPETKVLYMSGYTDDAIVLHGVLMEGVNFIQKPFTVDALTTKLREVLEK
jgi:PAS domain S-box-containing protein